MLKNPVYFYEDINSTDVEESLVGRKGLSLFLLKDYDVPVPPFFVISAGLYKSSIYEGFKNKVMDWVSSDTPPSSDQLIEIVKSVQFSKDYQENIRKNYNRLSGFADVWVSVRSSVVYTKDPSISFSGIFATQLNVKGTADLLEAIKGIYSSAFTEKALSYYKMHGVKMSDVKMAVVVQKMVQAQVSGITFTVDPVTMDNSKLSIEAVFGLGDVLSNNEMTPDLYVLKKDDLSFLEKRVSPQEWMLVRKPIPVDGRSKDNTEKVNITKSWSHQQKLDDRFIKDVAKLSLIVEDKSLVAQNIEWVWESGSVWVLQNKEIKESTKKIQKDPIDIGDYDKNSFLESAIDMVSESKLEHSAVLEAVDLVEKRKEAKEPEIFDVIGKDVAGIVETGKVNIKRPSLNKTEISEFKSVLRGVGASFGEISGRLKILDKNSIKNISVTKDDVLLVKDYQEDNIKNIEHIVLQSGGVITEEGGLSSALAILCRENGIPAVLDVDDASSRLGENLTVKIDGMTGEIMRKEEKIASDKNDKGLKSQSPSSDEDLKDQFMQQFEGMESDLAQFEGKFPPKKEKTDAPVFDIEKPYSDLDRLMGIKKEIEQKYEKKLDKEFAQIAKEEELANIVYDEKKKIVTATKVLVNNDNIMPNNEHYESALRVGDGICYVDLATLLSELLQINTVTSEDFDRFARRIDHLCSVSSSNEIILMVDNGLTDDEIKKLLKTVRRARNKFQCRNLSIMVSGLINSASVTDFKKNLSALGLGRSRNMRVYVNIDKVGQILFIDDICDVNVDGFVIDFVKLSKELIGKDNLEDKISYDIVDRIINSITTSECARKKYLIANLNKYYDIAQVCVKKGFYAVAVDYTLLNQTKDAVARQEQEMFK